MQRCTTKDQHSSDHHLCAAMGDDRARDDAGDGAIYYFWCGGLSHLPEVFSYPIEYHDCLVHRVAEYRQNRRQYWEGEFPLEESEEAQDDHDVMQVCDDCR